MDIYLIVQYFRFCRIRVDGKRLFYCKNKSLINAIELIGYYKAPYDKRSAFKRGIDYVCASYKSQYKETLYKTELRRLVRPSCKRRRCLYFPKRTLKILECITSCIDIPADGTAHVHCMNARDSFCAEMQLPALHCYYYLVYDLVTHLRALEGRMDHRCLAYKIFRSIENHPKRCGK